MASGLFVSEDGQKQEVQNEKSNADPQNGMNLPGFAAAHFDNAVENKTKGHTIGNAVAEGHEDAGKKGRDCFVQIIPVNIPERGDHHDTHHNENRSGGSRWNGTDEGCEKRGQCKTERYDNRGEACAAASADACGGFNKSSGVGGSE